MKPLLPSLKERKRYIAFEVDSDMNFGESEVNEALKQNLYSYIGEKGLALAGMQLTSWNRKRGILRVNHTSADDVKASFVFIKSIKSQKCSVHSVGMSGVLAKAKQKYMGYQK